MPAVVEQYNRKLKEGQVAEIDVNLTEASMRRDAAATLGLSVQVRMANFDIKRLEASKQYPKLSGNEFRVWRDFLPTFYTNGEFSRYGFDKIPLLAIQAIREARDSGLFDSIQIWCPAHKKVTDPMAVGLIYTNPYSRGDGACYYQIVRWGESLMSFSQIVSHNAKKKLQHAMPGNMASIPPAVVAYATELYLENPSIRFMIKRPFLGKRHCGKRTFRVNNAIICTECGKVIKD